MDGLFKMNIAEKSWNSIPKVISKEYLDGFGHPSVSSRNLLIEIIKNICKGKSLSLIDIGCGNGNLLKYLNLNNVKVNYTGVDFSEPLITAAKHIYPNNNFLIDDVSLLSTISQTFDIAVYSHVIECLASPDRALFKGAQIAKLIIIRFCEPPVFEFDETEIRMLNFGEENFPYLRRKMSKSYYQLILSRLGVKEVHTYNDINSNDQVHILYR